MEKERRKHQKKKAGEREKWGGRERENVLGRKIKMTIEKGRSEERVECEKQKKRREKLKEKAEK